MMAVPAAGNPVPSCARPVHAAQVQETQHRQFPHAELHGPQCTAMRCIAPGYTIIIHVLLLSGSHCRVCSKAAVSLPPCTAFSHSGTGCTEARACRECITALAVTPSMPTAVTAACMGADLQHGIHEAGVAQVLQTRTVTWVIRTTLLYRTRDSRPTPCLPACLPACLPTSAN